MGQLVFKDCGFKVGTSGASTDLSSYAKSVSLNYGIEFLDRTHIYDTHRRRVPNLKNWSISVTLIDNFADGHVDETLFNLVGADSSNCWIQIKPISTAVGSATNPRYCGRTFLESFPMGGGIGELASKSVTFQGDGDLLRSTSSGGAQGKLLITEAGAFFEMEDGTQIRLEDY